MNAQTINTQTIEATDFSAETTIITLDTIPTAEEINELTQDGDSIILEF